VISTRQLFLIDGLAGFFSGTAVAILHTWLVPIFQLPVEILYVQIVLSYLYACFSLTIFVTNRTSPKTLLTIVVGNCLYAIYCLLMIVVYLKSASPLGIAFLSAESLVVLFLARVEWGYYRENLMKTAAQT